MKTVDPLQLQATLRSRETVCIPELQKEYGLTYGEAVKMVGKMQCLGWLSAEATGLEYTVLKAHLHFRKLFRSEAFVLYEALTSDCVRLLRHLCDHHCASFGELKDKINGNDETQCAIDTLLEHQLIYEHDGCYRLCIRKKTVDALQTVSRSRMKIRRMMRLGGITEEEQVLKFLDELLGGDWAD